MLITIFETYDKDGVLIAQQPTEVFATAYAGKDGIVKAKQVDATPNSAMVEAQKRLGVLV